MNIVIYILCFVIAVLDLTYLKKHIMIRSLSVVIIAQALLINLREVVAKLDKIGPFDTDAYLIVFQVFVLLSTIYFMVKFKKQYDKG